MRSARRVHRARKSGGPPLTQVVLKGGTHPLPGVWDVGAVGMSWLDSAQRLA